MTVHRLPTTTKARGVYLSIDEVAALRRVLDQIYVAANYETEALVEQGWTPADLDILTRKLTRQASQQ
jgi:hypothetical protein